MKKRDVLFKGCTRPPMIFGVPLVPFAVAAAFCVLLSSWISMLMLLAMLPLYMGMRVMTNKDDQQFRLIFLKLIFTIPSLKTLRFWKASATTPVNFKKAKMIKISRKDLKVN